MVTCAHGALHTHAAAKYRRGSVGQCQCLRHDRRGGQQVYVTPICGRRTRRRQMSVGPAHKRSQNSRPVPCICILVVRSHPNHKRAQHHVTAQKAYARNSVSHSAMGAMLYMDYLCTRFPHWVDTVCTCTLHAHVHCMELLAHGCITGVIGCLCGAKSSDVEASPSR